MREEKFVLRTIAVYFACSMLWIVVTDGIANGLFSFDLFKGVSYVCISTIIIYVLVMKKLRYFGNHDALTDLPNTEFFMGRLTASLKSKEFHAVIVLRLDQLHAASSFYDRSEQSEVVKELAGRIKKRLESGDILSINSGHVLQILLASKKDKDEVANWLTELIPTLKLPVQCKGEEVYPQVHMGVVFYPEDAVDGEFLVKLGYLAVGQAAEEQKDVILSDDKMRRKLLGDFHMESEMRRAIVLEQFELYYQPKMCLNSEEIIGAEALIRWNHPERGMIPPDMFIPFAEQYGLIVPIGEWVIRKACKDLKAWRDSGMPVVPVSINLSVKQLWHKDVVKLLSECMSEAKIDPSLICIEITESLTMAPDQAIRILDKLKVLGVGISMDDFGTGYSSLANLHYYPLDSLKIDKSFVNNMENDTRNREIVGSMIHIAHALRLKVVAEGVETNEQYHILKHLKCDEAQGFLFSKPLPGKMFRQLLLSRRNSELHLV